MAAARLVVLLVVALVACEEQREPTTAGRASAAAPAPAVRMPPPVARLARVEGDVRVRRTGSTQWIPIADGAPLGAEDVVQAMDSGSAQIVMVASGATVSLRPSTTLQIPRPASEPLRVSGRMVVRVSATTTVAELRLQLPPGVLLLRAEPQREPVVEATVEVSAARSAVEMVEGTATVTPEHGASLSLGQRAWARFRADGTLEETGVAGPTPTLLAPLSDETVRTAGFVDLSWEPLDGATSYSVEIRTEGTIRRLESRRSTIRTRFATGDYEWTVRGHHEGELWPTAARRLLHVEVDDRPPALVIAEPLDHANVTGPHVRFTIRSEPAATITIGSYRGQVDARGNLSIDVSISRGLSNLVISARDDLGNERRVSRSLVWE